MTVGIVSQAHFLEGMSSLEKAETALRARRVVKMWLADIEGQEEAGVEVNVTDMMTVTTALNDAVYEHFTRAVNLIRMATNYDVPL